MAFWFMALNHGDWLLTWLKKNQGNILNIYADSWFSRVWDHLHLQCGHTQMHWARPLSIACFMALGRSLPLCGPNSLLFVMGSLDQMPIMIPSNHYRGFPGGASGKEHACQCRRHKGCEVDPWAGKIPWRRKQQPTPVFLPGESHGQRSLAGYSP